MTDAALAAQSPFQQPANASPGVTQAKAVNPAAAARLAPIPLKPANKSG